MKFSLGEWGLPLLTKELLEQAQQKRTYVVRALYCLALYSAVLFNELPALLTPIDPLERLGTGKILLERTHAFQCFLILAFMPVLAAGVVTSEKERNTLQLLLLTRLSPWNIVLEKFLSRLLTMAGFLLMASPLLAVAYPMGGVSPSQVWNSLLSELVLAFLIGSTSLACSAYCATGFSSFMMTYLLLAVGGVSAIFCSQPFFVGLLGNIFDFYGIWPRGAPFPFHSIIYLSPMIVGWGLLLLANAVLVSRATVQPTHIFLRLFRWLDQLFQRVNQNRLTRGIEVLSSRVVLPEMQGVAWREQTYSLAGSPTHLMRLFCLMLIPLSVVLFHSLSDHSVQSFVLAPIICFTWILTLLLVLISSTTLILKEKNRQTLEVLLSTPITTADLLRQKRSGVVRLITLFDIVMGFLLVSNGYLTFLAESWWIDLLVFLVAMASYHLQLTIVSWMGMMLGASQKDFVRALGIGIIGLTFAWWLLPLFLGNLLPGFLQSSFVVIFDEQLSVETFRPIKEFTVLICSPLSILEWGWDFQHWIYCVRDWPWTIVVNLGYLISTTLFVSSWSLSRADRILQRLQIEKGLP